MRAVCYTVTCATALVAMIGCEQSALMQLSRETDTAERRVYLKQQQLLDLEAQNQSLIVEKQRLLVELETKSLTLSELNARLEALRKQNTLTAARTARERQRQADAEAALGQYQTQMNSLAGNSDLSADAKQKRIDALKKEIKTYLEMGLR